MFHPDYMYITDKLPASLVERAKQRLLCHSKDPVPLESISNKSERIESYLRHSLELYQNSLNRKRKTMNCKNALQPAPLLLAPTAERLKEAKVSCPLSIGTEELKQQLLKYSRDTLGQFMQDLNKTHEKQIEANHQIRLEIKDLKLRVQKVEKFLTYLKSLINPALGMYPNPI